MDPSTTANISATFYDIAGTAAATVTRTADPYRSATVDQRAAGGGLDSFGSWQGAVVLSSTLPLAAVTNEYSGNAASLGMDFRFDNYNGVPTGFSNNSVLLPQLIKNIFDSGMNTTINSTIAIQNTNATSSANVTLTYYNTPCTPTTQTHTGIVIPPGTSAIVNMQSELSCASSWLNSGNVTSDQPVAVVVNHNAAGVLYAYQGFTNANAGTTLYIPQLLYNVYDSGMAYTWGTAVMVMTMDQSTANVTMSYYTSSGLLTSDTKTASPAAIFDQRFDMPAKGIGRFYGSGIITSSSPIVALVNSTTNYAASRGLRISTSRAFAGGMGSTTVLVPQLLKNISDSGTNAVWSTGLQGELMGSSPAIITMTYYLSGGGTRVSTASVSPSSPIFLIDQRFDPTIADLSTMTASAVITSTQPFAVSVNMVGDSSAPGDAAGTYAGIGQ